jgi:hypothetical protein
MAKAIWDGALLAESGAWIIVEGDHYVPTDTIKRRYFKPSETQTTFSWKGEAMICAEGRIQVVDAPAAYGAGVLPYHQSARRDISARKSIRISSTVGRPTYHHPL